MNEVFEMLSGIFEELRNEAGERKYSVQTEEAKNADRQLQKKIRHMKNIFYSWSKQTVSFWMITWKHLNMPIFRRNSEPIIRGLWMAYRSWRDWVSLISG